jgi:subtilisin family serine protease
MPTSRTWPSLDDDTVRRFVSQTFGYGRQTQDSPITVGVWIALIRLAERAARARHAKKQIPDDMVDVLITPWSGASPGEIASYLRDGAAERSDARAEMVALNASFVVARVDLGAMVQLIIPMTDWWQKLDERFWTSETDFASYREMEKSRESLSQVLRKSRNGAIQYFRFAAIAGFVKALHDADRESARTLIRIVRKFAALSQRDPSDESEMQEGARQPPQLAADRDEPTISDLMALIKPFEYTYSGALSGRNEVRFDSEFEKSPPGIPPSDPLERTLRKALREPHIYAVNVNRPAAPMLFDSRRTVKADAAQRLFDITTDALTFAVVDGGIDATHPGFLDWSVSDLEVALELRQRADEASGTARNDASEYGPSEKQERLLRSRIKKTYDFTRLRLIQNAANGDLAGAAIPAEISAIINDQAFAPNIAHLQARGNLARDLDWAIIEPLIEMRHDKADTYKAPMSGHGTHVAGILAADLRKPEDIKTPLSGMCPGLKLYDLRVFDDDGRSDEFTILSAIEFVGWLNRNRDYPVIHGVNLSLALRHYVDSYACGRTPICEACNHLAGSGTVVVAAAGNTGFDSEARQQSMGTGYRSISITDPGNADAVITVGSTHRRDPHAYGVSYFSSRGPTGDGRRKPDLVAPGEKITSTVPGGKTERMDGTSMAAPHVSGAAALLMARNPELIGRPAQIKEILMRTATDLGRERDFQGAGLVDVLRALQSI